jgi:hypothetical protein
MEELEKVLNVGVICLEPGQRAHVRRKPPEHREPARPLSLFIKSVDRDG